MKALISHFLFSTTLIFATPFAQADHHDGSKVKKVETQPAEMAGKDSTNSVVPDKFHVIFETTKGNVTIEVVKEWSPLGVERFHQLVQEGFFTDIAFFRVISGFMAQFGIHGDPKVSSKWKENTVDDDPVKASNKRGYLSFATAGPNTRTTQLFINFGDNSRLDAMGFSPLGLVNAEGMKVIDQIYSGYGEGAPRGKGPSQGRIQAEGNAYLKKDYPKLDYIKSAKIVAAPK